MEKRWDLLNLVNSYSSSISVLLQKTSRSICSSLSKDLSIKGHICRIFWQ